ncbi:hypothetical protein MKP08_11295 [Erythrobacter sp. LQ02-29]|uniref:hypothetical protein n=1 Tax=Erythrobacter sp. LQ02-29 TaxID=2920384 RepID=UPI001F4E906D|nr:hypothetical protein [Erythrobacter sp. LQ02-29]MCP9223336.1 hypothetical protein [Erythrobacter sp. LQ02-29]
MRLASRTSLLLAGLAMAGLVACGDSTADRKLPGGEPAQTEAGQDTNVVPGVEPKVSGSEPAVAVLQPIGKNVDVDLGPNLGGCKFEKDDAVLLIAGAPDDTNARGMGVIKVGGVDRLMTGTTPGGPPAIDAGPTMTDGEYTVTVERGSGDGKSVGAESSQWPADLIVRKDMANERRYADGTWTCGV